ncbi:MAG: 4Fe-4S binding protein [Bacillota bacterium]
MTELATTLCGVTLPGPLVLSSGPLSHDGPALVRAHRAGAGAVVTKTIRLNPAVNPVPHMAVLGRSSMLNAEKWSDLEATQWITLEIPMAARAGVVVIASLGHTPREVQELAGPAARAGASFLELVSYAAADLVPMVEAAAGCGVPVLAKLSPGWGDLAGHARRCLEAGAAGITAVDSYGPALAIDVATGRPVTGGEGGRGWLSGEAIKPLALQAVAEIALQHRCPLVGVGGVGSASDALAMLMVGATAVGVCTVALVKGLGVLSTINRDLQQLLERHGYPSLAAARGVSLPFLARGESTGRLEFSYDPKTCTGCRRCVDQCPYQARELHDRSMILDARLCRHCGLCAGLCAPRALQVTSRP